MYIRPKSKTCTRPITNSCAHDQTVMRTRPKLSHVHMNKNKLVCTRTKANSRACNQKQTSLHAIKNKRVHTTRKHIRVHTTKANSRTHDRKQTRKTSGYGNNSSVCRKSGMKPNTTRSNSAIQYVQFCTEYQFTTSQLHGIALTGPIPPPPLPPHNPLLQRDRSATCTILPKQGDPPPHTPTPPYPSSPHKARPNKCDELTDSQ